MLTKKLFLVTVLCLLSPPADADMRQVEQEFLERVTIEHDGCSGSEDCYRAAQRLEGQAKQQVRQVYATEGCAKIAAKYGYSSAKLASFSVSEINIIPAESSGSQASFMVKGSFTCVLSSESDPSGLPARPTQPTAGPRKVWGECEQWCEGLGLCLEDPDSPALGSGFTDDDVDWGGPGIGAAECVVGAAADCQASTRCREDGLCIGEKGWPQCHSKSSCRATRECERDGLCTLGRLGFCRASSAADCKNSEQCKRKGKCSFIAAATGRDLRDDPVGYFGGAVLGVCAAINDADCRKAKVCKDEKKCVVQLNPLRASMNICMKSRTAKQCAESEECKETGACSATKTGICVAKSSEDCKRSVACHRVGACSVSGGETGRCVVKDRSDCELSERCKYDGECTPSLSVKGSKVTCEVGSDEDCKRSIGCAEKGECTRKAHSATNVVCVR